LNVTHQLLVFADNVNIVSENISTIKSTEALSEISRKVELQVNTDKTKYLVMS